MAISDQRLTFGPQRRDDERRSGANVVGAHRCARELWHAPHDRMVALGADVRAHAYELVDIAEPTREQVFGDDTDTIGDREHRHEEGFEITGDTWIRQRRDVDRPQSPANHGPHTV